MYEPTTNTAVMTRYTISAGLWQQKSNIQMLAGEPTRQCTSEVGAVLDRAAHHCCAWYPLCKYATSLPFIVAGLVSSHPSCYSSHTRYRASRSSTEYSWLVWLPNMTSTRQPPRMQAVATMIMSVICMTCVATRSTYNKSHTTRQIARSEKISNVA
jgi:hypothetical protein